MVTYSPMYTDGGDIQWGETETNSKSKGIHLSGKSRFKPVMKSRQKNKLTFVLLYSHTSTGQLGMLSFIWF